ncbi:hypothetical protein MTO96_019224 [Rhipicephalus appendiculatus]
MSPLFVRSIPTTRMFHDAVLCEVKGASTYPFYYYIRTCGSVPAHETKIYHYWMYCFSGTLTFNKTTASEFCANYTLSVLSAKSLRTLFFVRRYYYTYEYEQRPVLIWDAGGLSYR